MHENLSHMVIGPPRVFLGEAGLVWAQVLHRGRCYDVTWFTWPENDFTIQSKQCSLSIREREPGLKWLV